jgi:prepilin-type N-terminal cleavage/methylation domain-containing protein
MKFFRQYSVGPYILDFYCPAAKLAVELDGGQHNQCENKGYDESRSEYLNAQGIEVARFWNHEVLLDIQSVLAGLALKVIRRNRPSSPLTLGLNSPLSPLTLRLNSPLSPLTLRGDEGGLRKNGVTLIELLIALVLSSMLTAALYRIFISHQKIYTVQDQVADMQQNVRIAMGQMTREIRMAGYGGNILAIFGNVNGFTNIITPASEEITVILADEVGELKQNALKGAQQLKVTNASVFNTDKKKYLCLNGLNNYLIQNVATDTITLTAPLAEDHPIHQPVYLVKAISYYIGLSGGKSALRRNENTGGGGQPLAENIESLEFSYFDAKGDVTANPADVRMVKVTVTARTSGFDPEYKGGDGYRRRTLSSNIKIRNLGL